MLLHCFHSQLLCMTTAKVHSEQSRRAVAKKTKKRDGQKTLASKTVYKSTLANPTHVDWPRIPANLQNLLLAQTIALLEEAEVAEYHLERQAASRRRRRAPPTAQPDNDRDREQEGSLSLPQSLRTRPRLLDGTLIGINAVTKRLEAQSCAQREVIYSGAVEQTASPPLSLVFACQADVQPPVLIDHLPQLVAACNSVASLRRDKERLVRLITFPPGSESILAKALGMRRASVLAFEDGADGLDDLQNHAEEIHAPLFGSAFMRSRVKQLRTSVPEKKKTRQGGNGTHQPPEVQK